jgi:hypothetical protein
MRDEVIIEVNFCQSRCEFVRYRDAFYAVLAEAKTLRR